jgi:predicted ATPase
MKYPKGSEWKKWDLHVHTPASAGYSGTYDQLINQIKNSEVDVVGINDYFTIAGYKEVIARLEGYTDKVVLPVVEMRMHNVLANRHSDDSGVRINFHIIFNPFDIEKNKNLVPFIESFIKSIKYTKTSSQTGRIGDIYDNKDALLNDVSVDYNIVLDDLEKSEELSDNYLIWLPYDEYGGVDGIKSTDFPFKPALINRAHIIGSSNPREISYFLGNADDYFDYFEREKPCIKGSDSHTHDYPIGKLKGPDSNPINKYCWIKADPTFDGLKQIVREPKYRVYIGDIPSKLIVVAKNKTKYIQALSIKKTVSSSHSDTWFNNDIEFNSGLIAIIGNKGKGKSALAEVLGLLGNSRNFEHFSFLKDEKFKKNKLASNFEANIKWLDDADQYSMNLIDIPDPLKVERVKCIPQNYLEILCNNLDKKFQDEIDSVIFSHIDKPERIGKSSLDDLITYKTQIIDDKISKIQDNIAKTNKDIIGIEDQLKPEYSKRLNEELNLITNELKSHCSIRPERVSQPEGDKAAEKEHQKLYSQLAKLNDEIKDIEDDIKNKKKELLKINEKIESLNIVKGKIEKFENGYGDLEKELKEDLKNLLSIELSAIVHLKINYKKINDKLASLNLSKKDLTKTLNIHYTKDTDEDNIKDNLFKKLKDKQDLRQTIQDQVDEPFKKYQKYLESLAEWRQVFHTKSAKRKELKKELERLIHEVPGSLLKEQSKRENLIGDLFSLLEQKVKVYETLYSPVINFIADERSKNKYMELNFSAEIMLPSDFDEKFLFYIDRGKKGSFQGIKESKILLKEIKQKYDVSKLVGIIAFIKEIFEKLCEETENGEKIKRVLEDQLVQGRSKSSLYAYFYLLRFLKIDYRLKWGEKLLEDLSPGERGAVLLIFYLLIDRNDVPLVMDQPEENLDNESIYYLLVRYIKEAKNRRQIFIVTHNPNLAVVCDAEQIIYCNLDKKNKYVVSYEMGSIENNEIKQRIINILEGTKPAFTNRQDKYEL